MKTKMLILVFLLGITDLFAQTLYVPGTIVKGKNASYYCSTKYEILIKVNNVNNVDTTTTMYYDDGTVVPYYVLFLIFLQILSYRSSLIQQLHLKS